jgi:hypothetical protein
MRTMRRLAPVLCLVVLVGCTGGAGGLSAKERSTIEGLLSLVDVDTAKSMKFTHWDSTTVTEGGKPMRVVRVKYTQRPGGTGDLVAKDILLRYPTSEGPTQLMDQVDNTFGDDWKNNLSSVKWTGG